jgi:ribosomal protein S12 methylthiotransferase accessory factor
MHSHQAIGRSDRHSIVMDIRFPGGLRVDALHEGFWIRTDQPVARGGGGEAPSPFDLFLASIGTCAGLYALRFCQQRNLDTSGLALSVMPERDTTGKRVVRIRIEIALPSAFPAKYREAILRAVDQCAVKRHLAEPPQFDVVAVETGEESVPPWARVTPPPALASSPRSDPS